MTLLASTCAQSISHSAGRCRMLTVESIDARVTHVDTRLPFRYGIAEMTRAVHVVVRIGLRDASGATAFGWSSENLPPKWFTKNPEEVYADEVVAMTEVIQ